MKTKVAVTISKLVSLVQLLVGICILFLFGLCTIMYLSDAQFRAEMDMGTAFLICCIILDVIGVVFIIFARKRSKLVKEFKKYVCYISNDPSGSIEGLAAAVGSSEDVVKKNLDTMINRNYFRNARVDQRTNCIVFENKAKKQSNHPDKKGNEMGNTLQIEYTTVTCKCCGGINKIVKGSVTECEYCGSPIKG